MVFIRSAVVLSLLANNVEALRRDNENEVHFFRDRIHAQRRNLVFNSRWLQGECLPVCEDDNTQNAPPVLPTPEPTVQSDCADMMNLGYGFSASMHNPSLGSSHFDQCYPDVQQMPNPPAYKGHDDSIAVLIGGDYTVINGAELEGNVVVMGNMHIESSGLSNLVSVGWGSQIVPHYGGKCVQVGGDLSSERIVDVFYGPGYCDVVYKGQGHNDDKWRHSREVIHDPNLDLTMYEVHMENLRKKSVYWNSLPPTAGASTNVHWGRMTLTCSDNDEIQVFHIDATTMSSVNDIYVYTQSCLDKTILVNVADGGEITMPAKEFRWTDSSGTVQRGGWENFDHCMNSNILWNFPYASKVTFDGYNEWNGSILITGDFVFKTIGQSGRTMVLGSVTQDRGGSEFHSFQFNPPKPLPDLDCDDFITTVEEVPTPPSYECVWPAGTSGFTLITKEDATTASHSHYTKVAVGGTMTDGAPNQHATFGGKLYYGSLTPGYAFNTNGGKQSISSLSEVPVDFAHLEWLATNIEADGQNVFVVDNPKSSCYNLFDFAPSHAQGTSGTQYLVVVKSAAPICFTKTPDGRQFGPTVLAPFSEVTLQGDAGYIDGTVIAKSFKTAGGNASQLQMHGKFYAGSLSCPTNDDTVQFAPPSCPSIDFDFSDLNNGDWLHDQFWESKCVKVTGWAKQVGTGKNERGFTPINGVHNPNGGAVRVFDTGNKNNCDSDLMTPSPKFYNGPDISCSDCCGGGPWKMKHTSSGCEYIYDNNGDKIENPYKNDKYLGNVLILQEYHAKGSDALEMESCPDDTGKGGYIEFEFCQPVTVNAGRLLDVDGSESADIRFFKADGTEKKYDVGTTGDNGYWRYDYQEDDVVKVKVEYTGSGSVEGINYSYCPETEELAQVLAATDAPVAPPTKHPTPQPTSGGGCCSQNWRDCVNNPGWCGYTEADCNQCGQKWLPDGPKLEGECVPRWGDCTQWKNGCCSPGGCVMQNQWWWQCL